jgi:uncharacterized protein HemY
MDPNFAQARRRLSEVYEQKGMVREAVAEDLRALEISGTTRDVVEACRKAFETSGIRSYWQNRVGFLQHSTRRSYQVAPYYVRLGDTNEALKWLERSCEERDMNLVEIKADPIWDPVRLDPRFVELVRRIGLTP